MPREDNFFEIFEAAAENAFKASCELLDFLEKFDDLPERGKRIKDLFTMTKLIMVFDHHETEELALAAFAVGSG